MSSNRVLAAVAGLGAAGGAYYLYAVLITDQSLADQHEGTMPGGILK